MTALAGALVHDPEVLFLDEPTIGLDPRSARASKDLPRGPWDRGKAILLSTHVLEIAERLCDRVASLDHGRLAVVGTMAELREQVRTSPPTWRNPHQIRVNCHVVRNGAKSRKLPLRGRLQIDTPSVRLLLFRSLVIDPEDCDFVSGPPLRVTLPS